MKRARGMYTAIAMGMNDTTYRTVVIAGRTRLTRAPSVVTPLPATRIKRTPLNRYARVASFQEMTSIMPIRYAVTCEIPAVRLPVR